MTLTSENIKENLLILCKNHHEWGTFRVLRKYDKGIWEIRNRAGDRTLMASEFKFWELAYVQSV